MLLLLKQDLLLLVVVAALPLLLKRLPVERGGKQDVLGLQVQVRNPVAVQMGNLKEECDANRSEYAGL